MYIILLFFIIFCPSIGSAEKKPNFSIIKSAEKAPDYSIDRFIRVGAWMGKDKDTGKGHLQEAYTELGLEFKKHITKHLDAVANCRFDITYDETFEGSEFKSGRAYITQRKEDMEYGARLRELYLKGHWGLFDLRAGYIIVPWGKTDSINPTDNITPRDRRIRAGDDDESRTANFGVKGSCRFGPMGIEGVWMPFFAESHLPSLDLPINMFLADSDLPSHNASYGIAALKVYAKVPLIYASASFMTGGALQPGLEYHTSAGNNVYVKMKAYKNNVFGADFSLSLGKTTLKGEAAYRRPFGYESRENVPPPDLWYVLGVDRKFFGQFTVVLQYIGKYTFDWNRELPTTIPALFREIIRDNNRYIFGQSDSHLHSNSLRLKWELLNVSLDTLFMMNWDTKEWTIYPKIVCNMTDYLIITAGGELYKGPKDSLYGMIDETKSSVFLELKSIF